MPIAERLPNVYADHYHYPCNLPGLCKQTTNCHIITTHLQSWIQPAASFICVPNYFTTHIFVLPLARIVFACLAYRRPLTTFPHLLWPHTYTRLHKWQPWPIHWPSTKLLKFVRDAYNIVWFICLLGGFLLTCLNIPWCARAVPRHFTQIFPSKKHHAFLSSANIASSTTLNRTHFINLHCSNMAQPRSNIPLCIPATWP